MLGTWELNEPASPETIDAAEAALGFRFPDDLRAFYLAGDGGDAWFDEHHEGLGVYVQVFPLASVVSMVEIMSDAEEWDDLITFGDDGAREVFCLRRRDVRILLVDASLPIEDAIDCGPSFSAVVERIAGGWAPSDEA